MPITTPDTLFTHDIMGRYLANTLGEALASADAGVFPNARPFDVFVIGGGSFGAALAEQVFDFDTARRHRVLVLEAGPFTLPGHVQNLPPMSAPLGPPPAMTLAELRGLWSAANPGQPVPALLPPRHEVWGLAWHSLAGANAADPKDKRFPGLAYCIGGRSLFWGGWSPRLIASEFAGWPAAVAADLNTRLYAVAERQLGTDATNDFINGPLHDELRARLFANRAGIASAVGIGAAGDLEAPLAVQSTATLSGFFPSNKFSSVPLLLQAVRSDVGRSGGDDSQRRLMVVPRCHVRSLGLGPNNRVDTIRTNQGDLPVGPNAIVCIALGTVESTRLALLSFPNTNGRIGRNLMAHLRSNTTIRIPRADFPPTLPSALQASALFVKGRQGAAGPHFHLQITGTGVRGDISDAEVELNQTIPNIDLLDQIRNALAQPGGDNFVVVTIRGIGEMSPDHAGTGPSSIRLDPEADENGVQRAIVTLGLTAADQALWNAMDAAAQQAAVALATAVGGGVSPGLQYFNPGTGQWQAAPITQRDGLGSTHHEGGTLWMGTDPATSVTDTVGRFHEVTNAFAAGPALFPVVGSPNPMLGGVALVRRAAEALLSPRLPPGPPVLDPGFQWLFSGANTNGWQMAGPGSFQHEPRDGGVMTSNGGPGIFWFSGRQFANFVLRLQWQSNDPNDNSGVFVRFPNPGNNPQVAVDQGYEIQIDDLGQPDNAPMHRTGAIYKFAAPARLASRLMGEWNDLEIRADGQNYAVTLNGDLVTTLAGNPGGRPSQGFIGVQNHHAGSRVSFRNIRIQPLP